MSAHNTAKTLDYIETSGLALDAAQKLAAQIQSEGEKIASIVPAHVTALKQAGLIGETDVAMATEKLSSHEGALAVITNLLGIRAKEKQAAEQKIKMLEQGAPAGSGEKKASASVVKNANYVGRRMGSDEQSGADVAFLARLGLDSFISNGAAH